MSEGRRTRQAIPFWRPAPERCHVRLHPRLVDEHEARRVDPPLVLLPPFASALHIGAFAFVGHQRVRRENDSLDRFLILLNFETEPAAT